MKELATALAKAQGAMKPAAKDSMNPHFKNKYADLASVWEACREPLSKNGLSVVQVPEFEGESGWLRTILMHSSGESIESRFPLRPQQQTAQGLGSAISYARRYTLAAMVGVVAEDDDGEAASGGTFLDPRAAEAEPISRAREWVNEAIDYIGRTKTAAELRGFTSANEKRLSWLKGELPDEFEALTRAIQKRKDQGAARPERSKDADTGQKAENTAKDVGPGASAGNASTPAEGSKLAGDGEASAGNQSDPVGSGDPVQSGGDDAASGGGGDQAGASEPQPPEAEDQSAEADKREEETDRLNKYMAALDDCTSAEELAEVEAAAAQRLSEGAIAVFTAALERRQKALKNKARQAKK